MMNARVFAFLRGILKKKQKYTVCYRVIVDCNSCVMKLVYWDPYLVQVQSYEEV